LWFEALPTTEPTRSSGQGFPITASQVVDPQESVKYVAKQSQFHKEMRAKQEEARRSGTRHIAEAEAYRQAEAERQRMAYEQEVEVVAAQAQQQYQAEKPAVMERYRKTLETSFKPRFLPSMRIETYEEMKEKYVTQNLAVVSERLDVASKQQIEAWKTRKLSEFQPIVPPVESISFWMQYNRPEWAYKYEPFETPEGYYAQIRGEHPELGLDIAFIKRGAKEEPTQKYQPSISDYMAGAVEWVAGAREKVWQSIGSFLGWKPQLTSIVYGSYQQVARTKYGGYYGVGAVGHVEAFTYSIAQLGGFKTPQIPSTIFAPYGDKPIEYYIGGIQAEWLMGEAIGFGLTKITPQPIKTAFSQVIQKVTSPISEAWRGSETETFLMRHSGWYRERALRDISQGLVSIPSAPTLSTASLEAEQFAWASTIVPHTSGIMLTKTTEVTAHAVSLWAKEHLLKTIISGGILAAEYETLIGTKTIMPSMPYIPQTYPITHAIEGIDLFIPAIPLMFQQPKLLKETVLPSLLLQPSKKERRTPFEIPTIKPIQFQPSLQRIKPIPFTISKLKIGIGIKPIQLVSPVATTKTAQAQAQKATQLLDVPTRSILDMPSAKTFNVFQAPDDMFKLKSQKRMKPLKLKGVGRQKREYPIMTEKQFTKNVLGVNLRHKK